MTMMALTRKRHRGLHLWALALGLVAVALMGVTVQGSKVSALTENQLAFSVAQSPAGGSIVQVGSTVTFTITATSTTSLSPMLDFDYPAGMTFIAGSSTPAAVSCADNTPGSGVVRCDYGTDDTLGALVPVTLTFSLSSTATTNAADFLMRQTAIDLSADLASDGDDSFATAGTLTVFNATNFSIAGAGSPATVFEGASTSYAATIQNTSGASTGVFTASAIFTNGSVTNIVCSSGTGGGLGGGSATCNNASLADTQTLTITATVAASNTANGDDITAAISAPGLGISQAGTPVVVEELGLDFTGSTLSAGTSINVCSGLVVADVANDAAAGAAQPGSSALIGQVSLSPLLTTADFQVSGPGVGVVSAAAGCGAAQSGVNFTPSASGAYAVTALYNTGGTNVLSLTVGSGPASNPVPIASNLAPPSANAASGAFTLTVTGTGFVSGASAIRWNGAPLATTFVNATTLDATVPAANILSAGSASVTVFTALPGGGLSNALTFTITSAPNPVPTVSNLSPNTIGAGAAQFLMTVTGTNFVAGSVVRWNGADLTTTYNSATTLTTTVPAVNVASAGAANVTVFNSAPGGGVSITPQVFTITPGAAKLAFTTQPGAGVAGSALAAQPVVAVQTAANATVTSDGTTVVTLVLTGAGTLTCTGGLTKTVSAGVAAFAGCAVSAAGTGLTITASAAGLTSATSATFDVSSAPPTSSTEVTVSNPGNAPIARSRLSFNISTGNLAGTAVSFIIRRKPDNKYWNATTGGWQTDLVLNAGTHGASNAWALAISGEHRRAFANTVVTVEARVTVGPTVYVNATIPECTIR